MGEGVCIGLFVGLIYLLIELLTDQSIKIGLYRAIGLGPADLSPPSYFKWDGGQLATISKEDLTRNIAPAALFLWPALLTVRGLWGTPWRRAGAIFLVLLTATVVAMAPHESSKLALVVSLGVFGLAHASLRWAGRLTKVAWVFACLAVVPAAMLAHRLDLHHSWWLQGSASHRIIIWNFTAEKVLETPYFGIGAGMTYAVGPKLERETTVLPGETLKRTLSVHSHNIYLQTWFELGLVGATLLTLVGLSILSAMRSLAPLVQPYAYATFASAATMAAASYGMWQYWFMALFGLCAVLFWVGARLLETGVDPSPELAEAPEIP
jgi:O-antigen ligase